MTVSLHAAVAATQAASKPVQRKPTVTLVLTPSTFSEEWSQRPSGEIVVGLRRLSAFDDQSAIAIAAKRVVEVLADENGKLADAQAADELYNNELFAYAVARSLCDPNDTAKAHPLFPLPEDQVPQYFTSAGIRFVWDHLHKMRLERSPLVPPADNDRVRGLVAALSHGALDALPPDAQVPARKLLSAIADMLPEASEDEAEGEASADVATYIVHGS